MIIQLLDEIYIFLKKRILSRVLVFLEYGRPYQDTILSTNQYNTILILLVIFLGASSCKKMCFGLNEFTSLDHIF